MCSVYVLSSSGADETVFYLCVKSADDTTFANVVMAIPV